MKQKRCISFLLTLCMLLVMMQVSVFAAATDSITVNVSIAQNGAFVTGKEGTRLAYTPVTITDVNDNESYDIDDVLYATHELYYDEGAASGYASQNTGYGLSLNKLWGDDSGAFGYYKDNQAAMSLADPVTDGSNIYAFIYQDKTSWSDTYTYFEKAALSVETGKPLSVQLNKSVYDDNWNPVELPVKNATITINGEETEYITNDKGIAEIVFDSVGSYTLSAITDYISTPPVYIVTVKEKTDTQTPPTDGDEATQKPDAPTDSDKKDYNVVIPNALEKIAATYKNNTDEWTVMDMGAYEMYAPQTENKLTAESRQKFINNAIATINASESDTAIDKAVLGLVAISKNPELLYLVNNNTAFSAIERLNGVQKSTSAWYAPYTLAVYNQGDYATDSYERELVNALLDGQQQDGSWEEWGTIDTTANAIAGLSFYKEKAEVSAAIEKAVNYLSAQQTASGTFSDGYSGANANSTAMVIIGLAAAGVDLINDTRFIKNDNNIIDGLLSFLVADGGGFGHTDNASISAYSTEQAFRALIAFMQTMETGKAFNVYDFSKNELTPARATGSNTSSPLPSEPSDDENITVTMTIKADTGYWLNNYSTTIPKEGATVYHAFVKACSDNSITHKGAENGYVSSITKGNITLAEFDKGENAGWLYKVNGELPTVGLTDFSIKDGDNIVWYYTEDWIKDPSAGYYDDSSSIDDITVDKTKDTTGTKTEIKTETAISSDTANVFTDVTDHWAIDAIEYVYKHSIMQGVSETEFAPDATMTRAMLVTVLYRLENPTEKAKTHSFADVKEGEWYAEAVAWAEENGIINGINETEFAPNADVTREQMAVVLYRYAQYKEQATAIGEDTNILSYTDAFEISEYAISAIQWMTGAGLMKGETEAVLNPKNNSTRAQVATILMRYLEQR